MQTAQHSDHGSHAPDPATDQTILTASEPPPPAYGTMPIIAHADDNPSNAGPAQVVFGVIGLCVLCFIFYVFINVTAKMKPGRT